MQELRGAARNCTPGVAPLESLEFDRYRQADARIGTVIQIVTIVIAYIDVVGRIPVLAPALRPWIEDEERESAVGEARVAHVDGGTEAHAEPMVVAEVLIVSDLRNVIAAVAAALGPGSMLARPVLGAIRLPTAIPPPSPGCLPAPLLLPGDRLLLSTLWLLLHRLSTLRRLLRLRVLLLGLLRLGALLLLLLRALRLRRGLLPLLLLRLLRPLLLLLLRLCALRLRRGLLPLLLLRLLRPLLLLLLLRLRALRLRRGLLPLLLLRLLRPLLLLLLLRLGALRLRRGLLMLRLGRRGTLLWLTLRSFFSLLRGE